MVVRVGTNAAWQGKDRFFVFTHTFCQSTFSTKINRISPQSSEIQFFGATTLHTKLLKHWHEVPQENQDELKQKLFQSIIVYANGPKIVLNRLCIAVSLAFLIKTAIFCLFFGSRTKLFNVFPDV